MRKTAKKIAAMSLAAAMLLSQAAYADNIVTAQEPGSSTSQGPTGEKELNENGYLEIGSKGGTTGFVNAGPGVSGTVEGTGETGTTQPGTIDNPNVIDPSAGTTTQSTGTAQTETQTGNQTTGNGQIAIDQSIAKPTISSETAVLYDATTGQFLFEKDADKTMYPASMTKLMTALLAVERLNLEDTITFSAAATTNLESGASNVNLVAGDQLTVRDALYALLLKSACEVANGIGEAVSGSEAEFAALMNARAKELGATNTNFSNASGLNSDTHVTTARDMALITKAALDNDTLRSILQTRTYTLPASQKRGQLTITNGNKMINSANSQYYEGILGGKTGYTSKAGNTLATAVQKNGHELVTVVMKSSQKQYDDTKALLDYGYQLIAAANGSTSGSTASGTTAGATGGTWVQNGTNYQYQKADGSYYRNEWLDLDGKTYFFGSDTYRCTGWRQFTNGSWYYFNPEDGAMVTNKWVTQDGKSYYLQADGTMAKSTVIDGTYRVDENGVYVEKVG